MAAPPDNWIFTLEPGIFPDYSTEFGPQVPGRNKLTTQPRLGLISRSYPTDKGGDSTTAQSDWSRFARYVRSLNQNAPANVSYKVLYLTRHGFGYHNKKSLEVGVEEWEAKWSLMDGDGVTTWFDAYLTDVGIEQAKELSRFWTSAVQNDGVPLPESLYTSPLVRCLETSALAFSPLMEAHGQPYQPTVKEKIRERFTLHTCDMRRPRSWIEKDRPDHIFEEGFPEEDPFRGRETEEDEAEHVARKRAALAELFSSDEAQFVSLATHSLAIEAILLACGAKSYKLREGTSIALLVRGECRSP